MMIPPLFRLLFQCHGFFIVIFLLPSADFSSAKMASGRIIGGIPAAPGAWPFMASILLRENATSPAGHTCGGIIWNEETILTAAHCLIDDDADADTQGLPAALFSVLLGQTDISSPSPEYTFQAAQVLIHPGWSAFGFRNDIGLLKLARPIDLRGAHSAASCICDPLPVSSLNGAACLALGWGLTKPDGEDISPVLMQVDLPLLPQDVCAAKYPFRHIDEVYNSSAHVCAAYLDVGGKTTCKGDSGGPLLCQLPAQPDKYSLVGLTSFGTDCDTKEPGYYTKVETYLTWIGQTSGE